MPVPIACSHMHIVQAGGLGLSKTTAGIILGGSTCILWAFTVSLQGCLLRRIGYRRSIYLGGLVAGCMIASLPFVAGWLPAAAFVLGAYSAGAVFAQVS